LKTVFTEQTEEEINAGVSKDQLYKKMNHAVAFNAIKNMAVDILFKNKNNDQAMEKLLLLSCMFNYYFLFAIFRMSLNKQLYASMSSK
jgi:hypothetical protein